MRRAKQYLKAILVFMIGAGFFITPTIAQDNTPRLLTDMVIENSLGDQVNYATYKDWFVECQSLKKTNTAYSDASGHLNRSIRPLYVRHYEAFILIIIFGCFGHRNSDFFF